MKRLLVIVFMFLLIFTLLVGCGGGEATAENPDVEVDAGKDEATLTTDETEVTYTTDMEKSLDIPDGYPSDVLPVYKDLMITAAANNADGSYVIVGFSNDELADIADFYEEFLEEANVMTKSMAEDMYINMGDNNGATYTITSEPNDDDELDVASIVSIVVIPGEMMGNVTEMVETDASEEPSEEGMDTGELTFAAGIEMPKEYPDKSMPIMNDKETQIAFVDAMNDQHILGYMTKSDTEDVVAYYEDVFTGSQDLIIQTMDPQTMFMGTIDGIAFQVIVTKNNESTGQDMSFSTLVQIFY